MQVPCASRIEDHYIHTPHHWKEATTKRGKHTRPMNIKSIKQKNKSPYFSEKRKMQGRCVEIFEQVQGTATNDGSSGMRRSTWSCRLFGCLTPSKRSSLCCPCCRLNLLGCCWVGLSLALDDDVSVVSVPILVRLFFVHDVLSETKKICIHDL